MFLYTNENMSALDAICESSESRWLRSAKTSGNSTLSFLVGVSLIFLPQFHFLLTFFPSHILFSSNNASSLNSSGSSYSRYYLSSLHTSLGDIGQLNHRGINQAKENIVHSD
jgi:hypothetical protein